jgi:hypothetical protein
MVGVGVIARLKSATDPRRRLLTGDEASIANASAKAVESFEEIDETPQRTLRGFFDVSGAAIRGERRSGASGKGRHSSSPAAAPLRRRRTPKAGEEISYDRRESEGGRWRKAAEPAVADMVGRRDAG